LFLQPSTPSSSSASASSVSSASLEGEKQEEQQEQEEQEIEAFALNLACALLMDGPMAPMYKALIDSGIGSGFAPSSGFDPYTRQPIFAVGLQDIADSDIDRVEQLIMTTLNEVVQSGFEESRVQALLHQIELSLKTVSTQFGISLMSMSVGPAWTHHRNLPSSLQISKRLEKIKQRLSEGPYFQQLLRKHMLDNQHRVKLVMTPDENFNQKQAEEEQAKVAAVEAKLSEAEKDKLVKAAQELKASQESQPNADVLPTLRRSDIASEGERVKVSQRMVNNSPVFLSEQPTNGITYVYALANSKRLPASLRPYLPLFISYLTEMGAGHMDYRDLSHQLDLYTGGISASRHIFSSISDLDAYDDVVTVSSHAFMRNISHMLELMKTVLQSPSFRDLERLRILLTGTAAQLSSAIQDSGNTYAYYHASSLLTPAAMASEKHAGVSHVEFVNWLVANLNEESLQSISAKLAEIAEVLLKDGAERGLVVGDAHSLTQVQSELSSLMLQQTKAAITPESVQWSPDGQITNARTFFALPIQVNHLSQAVRTVPFLHEDAPKLMLAGRVLSSLFLHREIREKGGAYGGGASQNGDGIFSFYSYRDPSCVNTLDAFAKSYEWLTSSASFSDRDVEEALLSLFSEIDAPRRPSSKGLSELLGRSTFEQRQLYRERLLQATKKDVVEVAERYLNPTVLSSSPVSVIGPEMNIPAQLQQENSGWQVKKLSLVAGGEDMEGELEEA